jgi:hypothetical protein
LCIAGDTKKKIFYQQMLPLLIGSLLLLVVGVTSTIHGEFSPFDENFRVKSFQTLMQNHPRFKETRKAVYANLTGY